jgi:hypothetical protein
MLDQPAQQPRAAPPLTIPEQTTSGNDPIQVHPRAFVMEKNQ